MHSLASPSIGTMVQYVVLAAIAYFLAGAPLLSQVTSNLFTPSRDSQISVFMTQKLDNLAHPDAGLVCTDHSFKGVYILNREPLVVYIEGFVDDWEAVKLIELSEPHFTPSTVWNAGQETLNTQVRKSEKAPLPRSQLVQCIEERARNFQGWRPYTFIEKLWSQRYGVGGHYTYHYDWSSATPSTGRVSSFMVYLGTNCTGGGTHFPRLRRPAGKQWCRFIECGEEEANKMDHGEDTRMHDGIVFKPIAGNAVYWENMRADGTGFTESWHAGLPVRSGVKVGLNIWSWFQDGYVPEEASPDRK
ncbi:hypothetical protein NX059_007476 [Plenodomus lindquistii]|nr:hypothetical protein NX059_007476 [Plenodomus lindquistii]